MNPVRKIKEVVRGRIARLVSEEVRREISGIIPLLDQVVEARMSRPEERLSHYEGGRPPGEELELHRALKGRLREAGVAVEDVWVDIADFEKWLGTFTEVNDHYRQRGDVYREKCLEHYLGWRFLNLRPTDIFIDVAAAGSPYADIVSRHLGLKTYTLDVSYPEGVHGSRIGADAGDTGLPEGFADALALHCAFECFMGNGDTRFVREASRVLGPGGRYLIAPLYLEDRHFNASSPWCDQKEVVVDDGALKVWRDDRFAAPFSRHYSPEAFFSRVYSRIPEDMTGRVLAVENLDDLAARYPGQRIYCRFLFLCEKRQAPPP